MSILFGRTLKRVTLRPFPVMSRSPTFWLRGSVASFPLPIRRDSCLPGSRNAVPLGQDMSPLLPLTYVQGWDAVAPLPIFR